MRTPNPAERPAGLGPGPIVAQLALVAVHVGVVMGFDRLFVGESYRWPLVAFVVMAHALAAAGRQWSIPAPLVAAVAIVGVACTTAWTVFPDTRALGLLPTTATWHEAIASLRTARAAFAEVVAPTEPTAGFQLAAGLALSAAVWFADWVAFRLRTTVEAVAPAAVLFVFAALLGSGRHEWSATVWFLVPTLLFVAAQRTTLAARAGSWLGPSPTAGPVAVLRGAGTVAVVAVLAGVLVGPRLPGATSEAMAHWRRTGSDDGTRITVSPMVELRKRLVDERNVEAFTVRSTRPAYWRLTSLDRFDGQIWSSGGSFRSAGDDLASNLPRRPGTREIVQSVRIQALSAIWVPVAYEAQSLPRSSEPLQWDRESGTLIVDRSQRSSDGLTYEAVSRVPEFDPATLDQDDAPDDAAIVERYRSLPSDFPALAVGEARQATRGATTRYQRARQLQDWFRSAFTYSLDIPAGHSDDALVDFLRSRTGYCEQFAGTYAAMARSLGIPSRVAVGFTPGDVDPNAPDTFHVLGRHAHAWPEVWFPSAGWVPFEPTPGRGIPDATAYTGVGQAQDDTVPPSSSTSTTTDTPSSTPGPAPTPTTAISPTSTTIAPPDLSITASDPPASGPAPWALVGLGALIIAAAALAVPMIRRWRESRRLPAHPVLRAWASTLLPVRQATGGRPTPAETHLEFAQRMHDALGAAAAPLRSLAELVSATAWSPVSATGPQIHEAERLAAEVRTDLAERTPAWWRRRLRP